MHEAEVLRYLVGEGITLPSNSLEGIPEVFSYSLQGDYNIMVMELLGKNLANLYTEEQFTLKTVLMASIQIVVFHFNNSLIVSNAFTQETSYTEILNLKIYL